jgi:hypothetical protein
VDVSTQPPPAAIPNLSCLFGAPVEATITHGVASSRHASERHAFLRVNASNTRDLQTPDLVCEVREDAETQLRRSTSDFVQLACLLEQELRRPSKLISSALFRDCQSKQFFSSGAKTIGPRARRRHADIQ